jgi:predicted small integral membrane protein
MRYWLMVLAAFLATILAVVLLLDWRASNATGRSLRAALPLVPSEGQRLFTDIKRSSPVEATKSGVERIADELPV